MIKLFARANKAATDIHIADESLTEVPLKEAERLVDLGEAVAGNHVMEILIDEEFDPEPVLRLVAEVRSSTDEA